MLNKFFKVFFLCFIFYLQCNLVFTTSWWVNDNWCHNSIHGYHCHNSWTWTSLDNNIIELQNDVKTWETYKRIIKKLKEKRSCARIFSGTERHYCYDILNEWDIYSMEEVLSKLKEKKDCDFFYSLKSDKNECEYLKKTQNIYTIPEIKKDTYSFSRCYKIRVFKKDYTLCKQELENKIKQKKIEKRLIEKQQIINKKFKKIREVIDIIYKKNPKKIQKFQIQIFDILLKLKEWTMQYEILKQLDEYLKILTWVDYKLK